MNLSRCKRLTLVDLYYNYPFKKNIPHKLGTVPYPFIKHSECTDTPNSLDWREYNMIISLYISKLKTYMEDGNSISLGSGMGEFSLIKFKANYFTDFKKSAELGRQVRFSKNNVENYFISSAWNKVKIRVKGITFWKVTLNKVWLRSIYRACEKDYTKIYKIKDARLS